MSQPKIQPCSGLYTLARDIESGQFRPTRVSPNGPCCWCIFGQDGDAGVQTGYGPRRIVYCLTTELAELLPHLVEQALQRIQ